MPQNINVLFDRIIERGPLKNDAALSRLLEVAPPVISKMRHFVLPAGPSMILAMNELGGLSMEEIRAVLPRKAAGAAITEE